jgi:hypothetical protein
MSQPPPYVRFDNYSAFLPIQGPSLNAEFDRIKTTLDAIMTNLKLAQRDDAKLNNGLVTPDSLAPSVTLLMGGWNPRGAWATSTNYVLKDMVEQPLGSGVLYVCPIGHTAGVFATDLTAGKWTLANVAAKVYTQVFTNSGTYTPRAGIVNCIIESWGGGGGGGGGTANVAFGSVSNAGGGGAGSYSRAYATAAQIGASQPVTIGAAGAAGASGANNGGNGGDTLVGALCVGKGGSGGLGNIATTGNVAGGAGGVAGTGDVTTTGMPGRPGRALNLAVFCSGDGGSSSVGGGAQATGVQGAGLAGSGHASGGGGGNSTNAGGAAAGGAGTAGYVVITEFCNQ